MFLGADTNHTRTPLSGWYILNSAGACKILQQEILKELKHQAYDKVNSLTLESNMHIPSYSTYSTFIVSFQIELNN